MVLENGENFMISAFFVWESSPRSSWEILRRWGREVVPLGPSRPWTSLVGPIFWSLSLNIILVHIFWSLFSFIVYTINCLIFAYSKILITLLISAPRSSKSEYFLLSKNVLNVVCHSIISSSFFLPRRSLQILSPSSL